MGAARGSRVKRSKPLQRAPFKRREIERRQRDEILGERQMAALCRPLPPVRATYASIADVPPQIMAKHPKLESVEYRRYVASFPCFACGSPAVQCCHANEGKGQGYKVCDTRTFPLCVYHHEALDNSRGMIRDERRDLERRYVEKMQAQARADGRDEVAFFPQLETTP